MERSHGITFVVAAILAVSCASIVRRQEGAVRPALSAGLTHNETFPQPKDVDYDRVFLDTTHSYNPVTGRYSIPVSGDYVVMVHAMAELDGHLTIKVFRNDDYLFSAFAHITSQYGTASNVGVAHFNQGDVLHVECNGTSILYGLNDDVYNTLSAYMLYERDASQ